MRGANGREALIGALVATAFWALAFVLTSDAASHYEICEVTKEGAEQATKSCASYNIISFAFRELGARLDIVSALITAVATAFIARYTFTLKRSTDKLWDAAQDQARITENAFAQLEGPLIEGCDLHLDLIQGVVRPGDPPPTIKMWLKNRGRGPGFI